jgi:hypothetical protein
MLVVRNCEVKIVSLADTNRPLLSCASDLPKRQRESHDIHTEHRAQFNSQFYSIESPYHGVSDGPWTVRGGRDRQTWSGGVSDGPGTMRDGQEV